MPSPLDHDYAKRLRRQAMTEMATHHREGQSGREPCWHWQRETIALMDGLNRSAGWPAKRTLLFVSQPNRAAIIDVRVVAQLVGGATPEITAEQEQAIRAIEDANEGALPLTDREWTAFTEGKSNELADLARRKESSLHPLVCWDDNVVADLHRFRVMHGDGN